MMAWRVAVQMDPIETVNVDADTTFALMEEAQARGAELFVYHPDQLAWQEGRIMARARPVRVKHIQGEHADLGEVRTLDHRWRAGRCHQPRTAERADPLEHACRRRCRAIRPV